MEVYQGEELLKLQLIIMTDKHFISDIISKTGSQLRNISPPQPVTHETAVTRLTSLTMQSQSVHNSSSQHFDY